jgi:hypothetical protein
MTESTSSSQHERDLRFLRNYFMTALKPRLESSYTNEGRILGVIVAATVAIMRGASVPPEAVRSYAMVAFVLLMRTTDLMAVAPISEPAIKKLAHCLAIVSRTLDAASAHAPASLNDVLNSFPKVSSVVLERLWREQQFMLTTVDLMGDAAQERIAELESKVG